MKDSLKYLELWQKKRSELQVSDDPQTGWLQMQSVLDQVMPVAAPHIVKKPTGLKALKALKLLPKLFIGLSAAAAIYTAAHVILSNKHKHKVNNPHHQSSQLLKDSTLSDSLAKADSVAYLDSLSRAALSDSAAQPGSSVNNDSVSTGLASTTLTKNGATANATANKNNLAASNQAASSTSVKLNKPGLGTMGTKGALAHTNVNLNPAASAKNNKSGSAISGARKLSSHADTNLNAANKSAKINKLFNAGKNSNRSAIINQHPNHHPNHSLAGNKNSSSTGNGNGLLPRNRLLNGNTNSTGQRQNNAMLRPGGGSGQNLNADQPNSGQQKNADQNSTNAVDGTVGQNTRPGLSATSQQPNANPGANSSSLTSAGKTTQKPVADKSKTTKAAKRKSEKSPRSKNTDPSNLDWGIMIGVNSSGGPTPYPGLFATYKLNDTWGIGSQVKLFSPQNINTTYSHANGSKVDSGQSLQITASRKQFSLTVPVYLVYKASSNISFKLGPAISFPVKQTNTNSTLQPAGLKKDTAYYTNFIKTLDSTNYQKQINFGISGGVSIQVKRFIFEANYLKSLSGYKVSNALGTFKSNNGVLQFSIGFQLDKVKP